MIREKIIRKINTLCLVSTESAEALLAKMHQKIIKRNGILIAEGEICKEIYFIETGCFRSFTDKDDREVNLSFTLEDDFVTNLKSLRNESPSTYTIKSCESSIVWSLSKKHMFELYETYPEINNMGRLLLEQLLIEQEDHTNFLKINTPAERYEYILKNRPQLLQKVSLTQLSSYIGISRESLSRIRQRIL